MFAINSQRVLARATCRAPDVVTGLIKLNLVEFFCFVIAQYFGELYLDTPIIFILVSVRNVQIKGQNLISMKSLCETCIHQLFTFPRKVLSMLPEYSKAVNASCMFQLENEFLQ